MAHNESQTTHRTDRMIDTPQHLRALYPPPGGRALRKQMDALDRRALRFIALSPFVVLSTSDVARCAKDL